MKYCYKAEAILILLCIILITLFNSCSMPQSSIVSITNNSGKIIKNFEIRINASYGEIEKEINLIEINETCNVSIELTEFQWGIGAGIYAATFSIQYEIDGVIFDIRSDEDVNDLMYNNNATLSQGQERHITIKAESYKID